jgi:two-component system, LuxR family, response regulator FixJ
MSGPADRVYVVDDDPDHRVSVVQMLAEAGCPSRAFPSGAALLATLASLPPGCIVVGLSMPNMNGLELRRQLVAAGCRWPVILLSGHATRAEVAEAMEAGFLAFLEKPVRQAELLAAVLRAHAHLKGKVEIIPDAERLQKYNSLTDRQKQVFDFYLDQTPNKQSGALLGLKESTVKGYRAKLLKKLGLRNTNELLVFAIRAGLYDPRKPGG